VQWVRHSSPYYYELLLFLYGLCLASMHIINFAGLLAVPNNIYIAKSYMSYVDGKNAGIRLLYITASHICEVNRDIVSHRNELVTRDTLYHYYSSWQLPTACRDCPALPVNAVTHTDCGEIIQQ